MYWGLGTGGGTIVGGYVSHVFGFRSTFRGFAVVTGVVLAMFLTTQLVTKYSELPQDDGNEESDEMYSTPERPDKKSQSVDDNAQDDNAQETREEEWKTPSAGQPIMSSEPTDSAQAGDLSQTGKLREPAVSEQQSAECPSQNEGDPDELHNTSEQTSFDDTTQLLNES